MMNRKENKMGEIICASCGLTMRVIVNGVICVYTAYDPPEPQVIKFGDLYKCRQCDEQVISGLGTSVYDFKKNLQTLFQQYSAPDELARQVKVVFEIRKGIVQYPQTPAFAELETSPNEIIKRWLLSTASIERLKDWLKKGDTNESS